MYAKFITGLDCRNGFRTIRSDYCCRQENVPAIINFKAPLYVQHDSLAHVELVNVKPWQDLVIFIGSLWCVTAASQLLPIIVRIVTILGGCNLPP